MTQKALNLRTERRLPHQRAGAAEAVHAQHREARRSSSTRLDLESYFRKTHGVASVEGLDIALIQPDKTWEFKVDGYAKYKPIEQELAVPFDADQPGVCIVNVSEEDLEATTLAIRSDLDLILKSSRREALVFVQDMRQAAAGRGRRTAAQRRPEDHRHGQDRQGRRVAGQARRAERSRGRCGPWPGWAATWRPTP